jgi:hypothetical protein
LDFEAVDERVLKEIEERGETGYNRCWYVHALIVVVRRAGLYRERLLLLGGDAG